jgi:hypothetical protein
MGPRIEPCGTPLVMCDVGGIADPTFSACCLRLRSEFTGGSGIAMYVACCLIFR